MPDVAPVLYLMTGMPGSGKTTYAKVLERSGVVRVSVDELTQAFHGRAGKDYPGEQQGERERCVIDTLPDALAAHLRAGRSVVLDHGLGQRADRDRYKRLATDNGAAWRLVYFDVDRDELIRRLADRNAQPASGIMPTETLDWMIGHADPPKGEGEERL